MFIVFVRDFSFQKTEYTYLDETKVRSDRRLLVPYCSPELERERWRAGRIRSLPQRREYLRIVDGRRDPTRG